MEASLHKVALASFPWYRTFDMDFAEDVFESFAGTLLIASPALTDPTFCKTVLLLASHSTENGAYGYILNRPLGKTVKELLDDEEVGILGEIPIFIGGPVGMSNLSFASLQWMPKKKQFKLRTHLTQEQATAQIQKGYAVRAFIGYAGWIVGQLENELLHDSWIQCPPVKGAVESFDETLWSNLLENMGPYYRMISLMPSDLSLN